MVEIILTQNQAGRRFDRFLYTYLSRAPKSLVHKLLRKKRIKLNGKRALGNETTNIGDKVTLYLSPETLEGFMPKQNLTPRDYGPVDIIYEDDNILLVNKPAGLLTHSNTAAPQDNLISRLAYYLRSDSSQLAVCNRLDRNTSGLVACGKNIQGIQALNEIFANRKVDKTYLALVCGRLTGKGDLRGYLRKDEKANRSFIVDKFEDNAVTVHTEYESLKSRGGFSLIKVRLHTGRPHQIRAHFADLGHPLVGDVKYGSLEQIEGIRGQMLHCLSLKFLEQEAGPFKYLEGQEWQAPLPEIWYQHV